MKLRLVAAALSSAGCTTNCPCLRLTVMFLTRMSQLPSFRPITNAPTGSRKVAGASPSGPSTVRTQIFGTDVECEGSDHR